MYDEETRMVPYDEDNEEPEEEQFFPVSPTMYTDPGIAPRPNIYGVKIGSKYTVVFNGTHRRKVLTCVRVVKTGLLSNQFEYTFGRRAEGWSDTVYPLKQGLPRNDREMSPAESIGLTSEYVKWLLKDIPKNSGVVFCLPLIRANEGLDALIDTIDNAVDFSIGTQYFSEAWGAALGTVPIQDAVSTNVMTLNFGSSTVEVTLHASGNLIAHNVYTFGGSEIDMSLMNVVKQAHRGVSLTESKAREIKEQYNWDKNNDVVAVLTLEGARHSVTVKGDTIRPVVSNAIDNVVKLINREFLRAAEMADSRVVDSLQADERGFIVLCGGMVNMGGFAQELYKRLVRTGAIGENVALRVPADGVIAPAIGVWKVGQTLESMRTDNGASSWYALTDSTIDN